MVCGGPDCRGEPQSFVRLLVDKRFILIVLAKRGLPGISTEGLFRAVGDAGSEPLPVLVSSRKRLSERLAVVGIPVEGTVNGICFML